MIRSNIKTGRITLNSFLTILSMAMVLVLMLIISMNLYIQTRNFITEKLEFIEQTKFYQVSSDIDSSLNRLLKIAKYMQNNKTLIKYIEAIESDSTGAYQKSTISGDILLFLTNIKDYSRLIKGINILTRKAQYNNSNGMVLDYLMVDGLREAKADDLRFIKPPVSFARDMMQPGAYIYDTSLYFTFNLDESGNDFRKVYIFIEDKVFGEKAANTNLIYILDENRNAIYRNDGVTINAGLSDIVSRIPAGGGTENVFTVDKTRIYSKQIAFKNWTLLFLTDTDFMRQQIGFLLIFIVIAFIFSFMIAYAFSRVISNVILHPLIKLRNIMVGYNGKNSERQYIEKDDKNRIISLRDKIFYYLIITVLLPVLIFTMIMYFKTRELMTSQILNSYSALFGKTAVKVNEYLTVKNNVIERIALDRVVQSYIMSGGNGRSDETSVGEIIRKNVYLGLDRDILSIYDRSNNLLISNAITNDDRLNRGLNTVQAITADGMLWGVKKDGLGRHLASVRMPIIRYPGAGDGEVIGYFEVDIDNAFLTELYSELITNDSEVFIVDGNGRVISHPKSEIIGNYTDIQYNDSSGMGKINYRRGKTLLIYRRLDPAPLYLVCLYNYRDVIRQSTVILINNIFFFIIIFLFSIILSYMISLGLLKPVNRLNRYFSELNLANLYRKFPETHYIDEISMLGKTFNKMTERIEDLVDELVVSSIARDRLESEKKTAEIIALQAQINPHFLYNTLDMINYMVKQKEAEKAVCMINSLSDLFRYGINREEIIISINDELSYTRTYTEILTILYNKNIRFNWNIDGQLLDYRTIKLILQPVVENAVYHGLGKRKQNGVISISCVDDGEDISFIVDDNGAGIPGNELAAIKANLAALKCTDRIGIYNVQSRIHLYFGEKYGLTVDSRYGTGTSVKITIPKTMRMERI